MPNRNEFFSSKKRRCRQNSFIKIIAPQAKLIKKHALQAISPRSPSLRRVSIQKPASRISQLSRRENGPIFPNINFELPPL